jgi:hypothetical protein
MRNAPSLYREGRVVFYEGCSLAGRTGSRATALSRTTSRTGSRATALSRTTSRTGARTRASSRESRHGASRCPAR